MKSIWVVIGQTGEYDDFRDWLVAAYEDRSLAEQHAVRAGEAASKLRYRPGCTYNLGDLDPNFQLDYTGASYDVVEVSLLSAVPGAPA